MEMNQRIARVSDAASLAAFLEHLRSDEALAESITVDNYLEQMEAFVRDGQDGYLSRYAGLPDKSWSLVADLLFAAAIYE